MSNLKVLVEWKNSTVHAGDDVECKITFRNICSSIDSHQLARQLSSSALRRDSWTEPLRLPVGQTLLPKPPDHATKHLALRGGSHRSTCSNDTSLPLRQASSYKFQDRPSKNLQDKSQKSHKRSISIVSVRDEGLPHDKSLASFPLVASKRPIRAHGRALSFQALPRAKSMSLTPTPGKQLQPLNSH